MEPHGVDPRAFALAVRELSPRLMGLALGYVRDPEEARDVLQEALLSAFRGAARFEGRAQISTWLHRIVVNAALMHLRARARRPQCSLSELTGDPVHSPWTAPLPSSLDLIEQRRTRAWVRAQVERLPAPYRSAVVLCDLRELEIDEAAGLLRITREAMKMRLHRGRRALRELMQRP